MSNKTESEYKRIRGACFMCDRGKDEAQLYVINLGALFVCDKCWTAEKARRNHCPECGMDKPDHKMSCDSR
jgi:hypothetical protein